MKTIHIVIPLSSIKFIHYVMVIGGKMKGKCILSAWRGLSFSWDHPICDRCICATAHTCTRVHFCICMSGKVHQNGEGGVLVFRNWFYLDIFIRSEGVTHLLRTLFQYSHRQLWLIVFKSVMVIIVLSDSLLSCCQYVNVDIVLAQSEGIFSLCDAPKNSGQYYDAFCIAGVSFSLDFNCISRWHA